MSRVRRRMVSEDGYGGRMSNGSGRTRQEGERHLGAVTVRREAIPPSTADERLLDSRGRAD